MVFWKVCKNFWKDWKAKVICRPSLRHFVFPPPIKTLGTIKQGKHRPDLIYLFSHVNAWKLLALAGENKNKHTQAQTHLQDCPVFNYIHVPTRPELVFRQHKTHNFTLEKLFSSPFTFGDLTSHAFYWLLLQQVTFTFRRKHSSARSLFSQDFSFWTITVMHLGKQLHNWPAKLYTLWFSSRESYIPGDLHGGCLWVYDYLQSLYTWHDFGAN